VTASFVYDGLGRRKSKTIGGTTTGFWYDLEDILAELSGGTPSATYIRGLSIDEPYIRKGASDEFYQADALGSPVALTNAAGVGQTSYTYQPFGATIQGGTSSNPFQFTSRENDGTGLYYYRARYYHPRLQRFLNEDPVGFSGGDVNRYAYVGNGPLDWSDPSGLKVYISGHLAGPLPGPLEPLSMGHRTTPQSYHLSLVLVPDDPAAFRADFMTLGAHADVRSVGRLKTTPNYSTDFLSSSQFIQIVPAPPGVSDTEFINSLINAACQYKGDLVYSVPTATGYMPPGSYNSNSFVSGAILAAGGTVPKLNSIGPWGRFLTPGYSNPFPAASFDRKKSCGRQ
jgi:RHS repeat-associated protein